jgi:hypothetical protein
MQFLPVEHRLSTPQEVCVLSYSLSQTHTNIHTVTLDYPKDGGSNLLRNAGSYLTIHLASYPERLKSSNLEIIKYEKLKQRDLHSNQQQKCRPLNARYWNQVFPMLRP